MSRSVAAPHRPTAEAARLQRPTDPQQPPDPRDQVLGHLEGVGDQDNVSRLDQPGLHQA